MIDLHSHVLPGIDDGAETLEGSLEILRAAAESGIAQIAATPHVRDDYPTTPETMERGVADLNAAARAAGVAVEVLTGGELDRAFAQKLDDETLRRYGLGGSLDALLVEFPYTGWPLELRDLVFRLGARGFRVVLAHPERNGEVQQSPGRVRELVDAGVLVQLTAASLDGRGGRKAAACARTLLDEELAHLIATDAHAPAIRAVGMNAAVEAVGDADLARWLTHDVPSALVTGSPLPPRPQCRARRLRLHRRSPD
ncbi:MAG TPA: CpsB/CapC family capsule biosynthesis tyrosine phosphatase [Gaiellaceae bacterium]